MTEIELLAKLVQSFGPYGVLVAIAYGVIWRVVREHLAVQRATAARIALALEQLQAHVAGRAHPDSNR